MDVPVVAVVGHGATELAAFDAALVAAGLADSNLLYLRSALPPGATVHRAPPRERPRGGRVHCVVAQARASVPGQEAWAGIGWAQDDTGRGLLVDRTAHDRATLEHRLRTGTAAGDLPDGLRVRLRHVVGARSEGDAVCALVVAVFEPARCTARDLEPGLLVGVV